MFFSGKRDSYHPTKMKTPLTIEMKKFTYLLIIIFFVSKASAQTFHTGVAEQQHNQSISISTGTQGAGLEYRYGFSESFSLRAGGNALPVNTNGNFKLNGFHSQSNLNAKFANVHLLADFTPFQSLSFLRLVAGAGYFTQAKGDISLTPTDAYKYGDIVLSPEQVGTMKLNMNWQGYAPYVGLGLIHAFPQGRFNINLDLGTYYLQQPKAQILATGILEGNTTQSAQFQKNLADYRWYPQLQLNFNFKL